MVTRLSPAAPQMTLPTSALPVKLILRMRSSSQIAQPIEPPGPVIQAMASSGSPASIRTSTSFNAESGVSVAGLMSTALPPAMAGPTLCATRFKGKLKGVIAATIPTGTRRVNPSLPTPPGAASSGNTSPVMRRASSAERSMVSAARATSSLPSARILPSSVEIIVPRSSTRSRISAAAWRRISHRCIAGIARMTLTPSTRPSTAAVISAVVASGTVSNASPS